MSLLARDPFRDYAYVSARKVVRMSKTLKPRGGLRDLGVKLGPVEASASFDADPRAEDTITQVARVERAIVRQFSVRDLGDPQLRPGNWFKLTGVPMTYGIPYARVSGVLFLGPAGRPDSANRAGLGEIADRRFVLGGSSQYLLDRGGHNGDGDAIGGSVSRGMRDMLRALVGASRSDEDALPDWHVSFDDVNLDRLARLMSHGGEPMTALARCLDIVSGKNGETVIGTPLYVAFDASPRSRR